jgi:hypothetical protein
MDDPMYVSTGGDFELEQRLDRFATVRLSPDAAAVARMRARVMREARLSLAADAEARTALASVVVARERRRRVLFRRTAALMAAAVLSLGLVTGAMAASQPGGPLYDLRVSLEALALPVDLEERAEAEVVRLESRLDEILAAARIGDPAAVQAALRAYAAIADEAVAAAGLDEGALERIQTALGRHVAVLQGIVGGLPAQAAEAIEANIERAIEHNGKVLERIEAASQGGGKPATPPGAGWPGEPAAQPAKTAKPDPTPKPTKAPKPDPTPVAAPQATPEAAATAPPAPGGPPSADPTERPGRTPPGRSDRAPAP